jgi:hypothetical protein
MREKLSVRKSIEKELYPFGMEEASPGKASDYIHHLLELIKQIPDLKVVLHCRVSGRMPGRLHHNLFS